MKKNNTNSYNLVKCYPVSSNNSSEYTKDKVTENFTSETSITPSFQDTLKSFFPDQNLAILGGVIVVLIIIILFMLMSGGGGGRRRRRRRYDDDYDDY